MEAMNFFILPLLSQFVSVTNKYTVLTYYNFIMTIIKIQILVYLYFLLLNYTNLELLMDIGY